MDRLNWARAVRVPSVHWRLAAGAGLIVAIGLSPAAIADDGADMRQELKEMRKQYESELTRLRRDYDARLSRLEARLKAAEKAKTAAGEMAPPATEPTPAPLNAAGQPPQLNTTTAGLDLPPPAAALASASAQAGAFNPAIGVVLQGKASAFSRNPDTYRVRGFTLGDEADPGRRGLSLDESELNFQANVDPYLFGNLTLSISPDNHLSIEEAFLQTTSLPGGFTLRAGRFFSGIGYLNEQHSHTWDFADQALPYRVFLNNQYDDDGLQLRWLAPTRQFLELGGELFRGDAFPAGGSPRVGFGTFSVFAHTGDDIDESSSYRTGLSWLHSKASDRATSVPGGPDDLFSGKSDTLIFDAVYKWAPNGNPVETNLKLQGEFFAHRDEGRFNSIPYASGWQIGFYAQAAYQFMPRWRVGLRYDQVNGNRHGGLFAGSTIDSLGTTPRRASAMLEYNTSEFGRFRLQYNRDWSRGTPDDQALLQYIITLGAHGAHIF